MLLAGALVKHRDRLQAWKPNTEETRLLQFLVEDRRRQVDQKTGLLNQLTGRLKLYLYFSADPEMVSVCRFALAWRFLERWPDLESAQNVSCQKLKAFLIRDARSCPADVDQMINQIRDALPATQDRAVVNSSAVFVQGIVGELQLLRTTIQKYEKQIEAIVQQHPDFPIVSSFPGIGKALAPRLIAALGTQRERFPNAASIQSYSGIAPVREASGKREWVHVRWACRSSSNRLFRNGPSIRWRVVLGRTNTTMHNEPATKVTKRQSAVSPLSGFAFFSGAGKIGRPMTRTGTPKALVVDRPRRIPMSE